MDNQRGNASRFTATLLFAVLAAALSPGFQHGWNAGILNTPGTVLKKWFVLSYCKGAENARQSNFTYDCDADPDFPAYVDPDNTTTSQPVTKPSEEDKCETAAREDAFMAGAGAIYCLGGLIGALFIGISQRFTGLRISLLVNLVFVISAAILMGFAKMSGSWLTFMIGRFLIGFACGLGSGLAPTYINDIAPIHLRGLLGSTYQFFLVLSIVLSQVMGLCQVLGTYESWPYLMFLILIPAIFQLATLSFCHESPRRLMQQGRNDDARTALQWLRGQTTDVSAELAVLATEATAERNSPALSTSQLFTDRVLFKPMLISVLIMVAQQLSGINAIIFYSTDTFLHLGLSPKGAQYATIGMGCLNLVMTFVSLFIVDTLGRKTLLISGFIGLAFCTLLATVCSIMVDGFTKDYLASCAKDAPCVMDQSAIPDVWKYLMVVAILLFIVFFATGPGSIPWFIIQEINTNQARPTVVSLAVNTNWTFNLIVAAGFPPLQSLINGYVFLIFTILNILIVLWIIFFVPETKDQTIEQITAGFRQE